VVAAAAVALVAVVAFVAARMGGEGPDVVVVGDSVTDLAREDIFERVEGRPQVVAIPGARSDQMLGSLETAMEERTSAGQDLEQVAVLVGYNDVGQDTFDQRSFEEMVADTAEFECAVWLALPDAEGLALDAGEATAWNDRLSALVEPYEGVHLDTQWQDEVNADDTDRLLDDDLLHPSPEGAETLAEAYRDALSRHC
jgi:lysophospholipase L1-like esterase